MSSFTRSVLLPVILVLLYGCGVPIAPDLLLGLAENTIFSDKDIVDLDGQETENIYDPLNLLKRGDAYRGKKDYVAAVEEYQRFLELYPFHRMTSFAQYSLGLCYYGQIRSIDRDPNPVEQALVAFNKVLTHYPDSLYAEDASIKIANLRERQARYEFQIGRYYFKKKAYPAAIARFQNALRKTGGGPIREQTLYYVGLSHYQSGNIEKAEEVLKKLRMEYPDSSYVRQNKIPL